tara:strand:+ start:6629 stop:6919 length:291 start_codon:yes stop_codon:yes gene_type:complete
MTIIKDPILLPYHIQRDNHGFAVIETVTPQQKYLEKGSEGKDYEKALFYPSTLGGCLKKIAELKTNTEKEYQSIRQYLDEFNTIYNNIQKTFELGV